MYKYYYIYKVTCTQGSWKGKFYYGQHSTNKLDDHYFASGKFINDYVKKYPNGYKREIICFCNSKDELNKAEYDIIRININDSNCLNIAEGGHGYPIQNKTLDEKKEIFNKIKQQNTGRIHINNGTRSKMIRQEELNFYISHGWQMGRITTYINKDYINKQKTAQTGKHHTEQYKQKMSKLKWMTNDKQTIRVSEENIEEYLKKGYILGRTFL